MEGAEGAAAASAAFGTMIVLWEPNRAAKAAVMALIFKLSLDPTIVLKHICQTSARSTVSTERRHHRPIGEASIK